MRLTSTTQLQTSCAGMLHLSARHCQWGCNTCCQPVAAVEPKAASCSTLAVGACGQLASGEYGTTCAQSHSQRSLLLGPLLLFREQRPQLSLQLQLLAAADTARWRQRRQKTARQQQMAASSGGCRCPVKLWQAPNCGCSCVSVAFAGACLCW